MAQDPKDKHFHAGLLENLKCCQERALSGSVNPPPPTIATEQVGPWQHQYTSFESKTKEQNPQDTDMLLLVIRVGCCIFSLGGRFYWEWITCSESLWCSSFRLAYIIRLRRLETTLSFHVQCSQFFIQYRPRCPFIPCTYIHTCIHTYIGLYTYIHTYIGLHTYMHTHTHTHTHTCWCAVYTIA
jgi:hypothetical protein